MWIKKEFNLGDIKFAKIPTNIPSPTPDHTFIFTPYSTAISSFIDTKYVSRNIFRFSAFSLKNVSST